MLTEGNKEYVYLFVYVCVVKEECPVKLMYLTMIQFINGLDQSKQNRWLQVAGCERVLLPVLLQSSDIARLFPSSDLLQTL